MGEITFLVYIVTEMPKIHPALTKTDSLIVKSFYDF